MLYRELIHIWAKILLFYFLIAYNTFYILGLLLSMQIPFVGFQPVRTSEHMASAGKHGNYYWHKLCIRIFIEWVLKVVLFYFLNLGVFILINSYALLKYLQSYMSKSELKTLFIFGVVGIGGFVFLGVVVLTYAGKILWLSNIIKLSK